MTRNYKLKYSQRVYALEIGFKSEADLSCFDGGRGRPNFDSENITETFSGKISSPCNSVALHNNPAINPKPTPLPPLKLLQASTLLVKL